MILQECLRRNKRWNSRTFGIVYMKLLQVGGGGTFTLIPIASAITTSLMILLFEFDLYSHAI